MKKNTKLFIIFYSAFLFSIAGLIFLFRGTGVGALFMQSFLNRDLGSIAIIVTALVACGATIKYCIDKGGLVLKKASSHENNSTFF